MERSRTILLLSEMACHGGRVVAALFVFGLGLSCKSPRQSPASADTLAGDTTTWGGALKLSIEAIARGDTSEALRLAERAIALNAEAPFPYELKGYYHYMRGEDTLAIWYYRQALERGGGSATLHYRLGSAYLMQKRWADAHYHLQRALILDSTMNDAWVALGLWAYLQRRFDSAEVYWRKALARDSTHDKARSFLYDLYLNQHNQPDTARKYFLDPYWRLNRFNPLLNFQLGNYYLKKLMMVPDLPANDKIRATYAFQAVQAYSQAILAHPTYVGAYYNRGYVHFLVKKYDRALEDFVRAVELDPKDARTHFMIGSIREVKGDYVRAREAYQRAVELRPDFTEAQEALRQLSSQTQ